MNIGLNDRTGSLDYAQNITGNQHIDTELYDIMCSLWESSKEEQEQENMVPE